MMVYLLFREAVYRHECLGVFATADDARAAADKAVSAEPDEHHAIRVYGPYEVGALVSMGAKRDYDRNPDYLEPESLYSVSHAKLPLCPHCGNKIYPDNDGCPYSLCPGKRA